MNHARTDVASTPHCPALPPAASGVALALPSIDELVLHGSFQLAREEVEELVEPHRALVVVVTCGMYHCVANPFRERVLFADDLERAGEGLRGYFTVDLVELVGERVPGRWFVHAAIGGHTSAVLDVAVDSRPAE